MAPSDYIQARTSYNDDENNDNDNDNYNDNKQNFMVIVDERPYFPFLEIINNNDNDPNPNPNPTTMTNNDNDDYERSIKNVVAKVLLSSSSSKSSNVNININIDEWTVRVVTGGITNKLYQVSGPTIGTLKTNNNNNAVVVNSQPNNSNSSNNNSVLVRIFGGLTLGIDRDIETSTFAALSKQGHAVRYYGRFSNGRVEDFCFGSKTLSSNEMYNSHKQIARSIAKLHTQFSIPWELQPYHDINSPIPTLWIQLESWWNQAITSLTSATTLTTTSLLLTEEQLIEIQQLELDILINEIIWLRETIVINGNGNVEQKQQTPKLGFCHNDLLAANILYYYDENESSDKHHKSNNNNRSNNSQIQLVDFEYGGINYLSYDIANHFNEYAGGTTPNDNGSTDYTKFPNLHQQRSFVYEYLKTTKIQIQNQNQQNNKHNYEDEEGREGEGEDDEEEEEIENNNNNNEHDENENTTTKPNNVNDVVTKEEVDTLLEEINGFVLANHLVWGLWAVNQALEEGCNEFDYIRYAKCRIQRYWIVKNNNEK